MTVPAWVITGQLDSGKTTIINRLVEEELKEQDILILQFENGDVCLTESERIRQLKFSKNQLENQAFEVAGDIFREISEHSVDLILIEWNGMEHFHKFEEMFLQFAAQPILSIEKVIYTAAKEGFYSRMGDSGEIAFSQIAASDYAFIRGYEKEKNVKEGKLLNRINPGISLFTESEWARFKKKVFQYDIRFQLHLFFAAGLIAFFLVIKPLMGNLILSFDVFLTVFLGVFLQAIPFLALGVLLSSAIQVFISPDWIQQKFPKKVLPGQIFAVLAGFCLPVCDCASIPVFRGLVKKGVPLPSAITFMLVSPVINPVVILSTWYAFNGNVKMIAARCGLGIVCAVLAGLSYLAFPIEEMEIQQKDRLESVRGNEETTERGKPFSRISLFFSHAQNEFFSVGKYLLAGIFISSLFQQIQPDMVRTGQGISLLLSILFLMILAFVLSLCSSSDAVVARSLASGFPASALLGFLVFGPMMDIKNAAMLLDGFSKRFVWKLFLRIFFICFVVVALFASIGSGGIGL